MKVSASFMMQEFMPRDIYARWREKCSWFLDPRVIAVAECYRQHFRSPVIINNWHRGGPFQYRGFREPDCPVGSELSQHKFGRAFDCTIEGMTADEVRKEILDKPTLFMAAGLTTLEAGEYAPTWVHSDCRKVNSAQILIVRP